MHSRSYLMEFRVFLEGHSGAKEDMVHKGRRHELEPDGHPIIAESAGYTQCRDTCLICRDGVDIKEIDTQRVAHHFIKTEGGHGNGWSCNDVADLKGLPEIIDNKGPYL